MAQDPRDRFMADVAGGQTFIDLGELFGIVRERISSAHRAGARSLTLLDMEKDDCPWWAE